MQLADFMSERGLDDEDMAARIRARGVSCDRSTINRIRNRKSWLSASLASAIKVETEGLVTADDCLPAALAEARP